MSKSESQRVKKIFSLLKKAYPNARIALNSDNAFQMLVATILSAQCTDERVNLVTKNLFKKYKSPSDFVKAKSSELEKAIFSTGFFRQKAKSIKACCKVLLSDFGGEVPRDFDALVQLPGVGRKTASVIAGNAFGIPAIAVDTHVKRLSNLLGFIKSDDAEKIELRLKQIIPKSDWILIGHLLMSHGRKVCIARRPKCSECFLNKLCPSANFN